MTKAIVGFKIKIDNIEDKAKLNQNHPIDRQELVIQRLEKSIIDDIREIATLMKDNLDKKS
ncbi:MAG TPA: hypothetical protein VJ824_05825 [Bacillota bacterium]|nr:hypothetical protein [Bacillota bacterium]